MVSTCPLRRASELLSNHFSEPHANNTSSFFLWKNLDYKFSMEEKINKTICLIERLLFLCLA
jgi:hypothetical protein